MKNAATGFCRVGRILHAPSCDVLTITAAHTVSHPQMLTKGKMGAMGPAGT